MSENKVYKFISNPSKKKKAKKVFDDNDVTDENIKNQDNYDKQNEEEDNNIDELNKKKKKKKKKKVTKVNSSTNDMNVEPFNIDESDDQKEEEPKFSKKKSKSVAVYDEINEENDIISEKKPKKKKKKKKSAKKEEEKIEEPKQTEEDEEIKPKKKKKKKKKKSEENVEDIKTIESGEDENQINNNYINEIDDINEDKPNTKKKKKKKKVEEEENPIDDDNIIDNNEISKKKIKRKKSDKTKKDDEENLKEDQNSDIKNESSKFDDNLKDSIFNSTKKKLGKIFFTKKRRNKNNDYLETEPTATESTIKEKNVVEFLEKAKGITYKGYQYKIKDEDYFVRKNIKIYTILNSEDAAIKKCEELSNEINNGERWIDPDFGEQKNNNSKNKESLYGDGVPPAGSPSYKNIQWYPLTEISDYAQFFSDGIESNDVIQGGLGDCWFISALSVIATKDYLLRGEFSDDILSDKKIDQEENVMLSTGVYPPIFHSFRKKGIFCFRFFKNFKWRYVLVDNRLPCLRVYDNQTPTPLYGKCRAMNEFWVSLIEKAYAKLHGSYRALASGFIDDGLVDLTGLTSCKMIIEAEKLNSKQKVDELWNLLLSNSSLTFKGEIQKTSGGKKISAKFYIRNKTMMGCSFDGRGNAVEMEVILNNRHTGILASHAYSILDVFEIPKPRGKKRKFSRLLRIRNPWGRKEWTGKWSDDSVETKQNKERIEQKLNEKYRETHEKINLSQEDGTFLMCFSDFRQVFNKLYICKNFPPSFIGIRIFGQWTSNESGGLPVNTRQQKTFFNNPQFYLQKDNDGLLSVSLLQNDGRLVESTFPFPGTINKVCLLIFKTNSKNRKKDLENLLEKTLIVNRRDNILELNLKKGSYIIIPSTLDEGKTGDYCLELHFEDELKNDIIAGRDKIDCLKYTKIEKLGGNSVKWEILSEFISSQAKSSSANKEQFIIQKFKEIIKDDDDYEYSGSNRKMGNLIRGNRGMQNYDEEEDLDYI